MKKKISALVVTCLTLLMISSLLCHKAEAALQEPQYNWVASIVVSEKISYGQALRIFCDLVYARTNGRVKITPHFAGSLGGERETFEAVKLGNIHIAFQDIYGAFGGAMFDLTNYPRLTSSHRQMADLSVPRDAPIHKLFSKWLMEKHDLKMMGMWAGPIRDVFNSKRAINALSDLKGLKIRVPETPIWVDFFKRIGVVVTPIAYPEVYNAMQTKVIDGHEGPLMGFEMIKTAELGKHLVRTQHVGQTYKMIISNKLWQSLPKDIQDILMQSCWDQACYQSFAVEYEEVVSEKVLKDKYGIKFTILPKKDEVFMDKTALEMLGTWREKLGPEASTLIAQLLETRIK